MSLTKRARRCQARGARKKTDAIARHEKDRIAAPRRERVEPGKPLHRLEGRRPHREGHRGGARRRAPAEGRGIRLRHRVHLGAEARHPHAQLRAGGDGPPLDPGREGLAAEPSAIAERCRASTRPRPRRNMARSRCSSGGAATTCRRRRLPRATSATPRGTRATGRCRATRCRARTECLKDTVARVVPYWKEHIAPRVDSGERVLVAAHGNSLRALIKYFDAMSDAAIVNENVPTGIPLLYTFDDALHATGRRYPRRRGGGRAGDGLGGEPGQVRSAALMEAARCVRVLAVSLSLGLAAFPANVEAKKKAAAHKENAAAASRDAPVSQAQLKELRGRIDKLQTELSERRGVARGEAEGGAAQERPGDERGAPRALRPAPAALGARASSSRTSARASRPRARAWPSSRRSPRSCCACNTARAPPTGCALALEGRDAGDRRAPPAVLRLHPARGRAEPDRRGCARPSTSFAALEGRRNGAPRRDRRATSASRPRRAGGSRASVPRARAW